MTHRYRRAAGSNARGSARGTGAPVRTSRGADARDGEGGFALLVSLIAIVGLTALATGGFFLADSEHKTSTNHHASVEAYHLAEAGLNQFLGDASGTPSTGSQGTYQYPDAGGEAEVFVEYVGATRDDQDIYRVRSVGRFDPASPGQTVVRQVGLVAVLNTGVIPDPKASVASGGGITKNGGSGLISGYDNCNSAPARAGVRVPTDPGYDGKEKPLEGEPKADSVSNPFDYLEPGAEQWWDGMLDGSTVQHDYVLNSDDSSSQWPDYSQVDEEMPVTYVDKNNIELGDNEDGRGLLIIRGNTTLKGNFDWDGVILIGGSLTDHGQGQIQGAVMTGLNVLKGEDVSQDDLEDVDTLDGTKKYLFDSCIVEKVQNATATLAGVSSTWHEEF